MSEIKRQELKKLIKYGLIFLFVNLFVNYIYRLGFHSISIEKLIMGSDSEGYYQYLPHFFLQDWSLFDRMSWTLPYGEGKTLSVYTSGVAILWSPFFLIAHFVSVFLSLDSGGYTNVYYGFIQVAGIFYTYLGLVFLYKFIREFFDHKTSLITTSLFFLATNIFFYSVLLGAGMSHVYSFSMIAIYVYYSHKFSKEATLKNLIFLGIPFALAVLIRPTNIISGLYFVLMGLNRIDDLKERISFWKKNYWALPGLLVIGLVVFIPQMAYWHYVTGKFLMYSYQDQGFIHWKAPQIGVVLFGKYNGWLTYTPLMVIAFAGLFVQLWKKQMNSFAVTLILIIGIYLNSSWWAPTFSAACGQRAMIDYLPFMAIPLAFGIKFINESSKMTKGIFVFILLVFIFYNIQFGFRYNPVLWWDTPMSWAKFWHFLKF